VKPSNPRAGQLIAGVGGVLLIVSLFLPWAEKGGVSRSGWELWTMADVFFLIAGLCAIAAAITGGRFRLFRPDLALIGAMTIAGGAGDYRPLRGASWFPRVS
jgi:hypothetical protein